MSAERLTRRIWGRLGGGWNDREPKYELRDWSADREKMSKGVTLSKEELQALKELLTETQEVLSAGILSLTGEDVGGAAVPYGDDIRVG
jgi:hypothetical protein